MIVNSNIGTNSQAQYNSKWEQIKNKCVQLTATKMNKETPTPIQTKEVVLSDPTTYPGYNLKCYNQKPAFCTTDYCTVDEARSYDNLCKKLSEPFYNATGIKIINAEKEIGSDCFWDEVSKDICAHRVWQCYGGLGNSNLGDAITNVASRYAAVKDKLINTFSQEELNIQLNQLDNTFNNSVTELGNLAHDILGKSLGNGNDFKQSTIAVFNKKVSQYEQYINENKNYSGLKGTENEDLEYNTELLSTLLRESCDGKVCGKSNSTVNNSSKALYTENELRAASDFVRMGDLKFLSSGFSAEEYGFTMGLTSIKIDNIVDSYGVREKLATNMKETMYNYFEETISDYEKHMNSSISVNEKFAINRDDVLSMYDYVRDSWENREDITETLLKSASELLKRYNDKSQQSPMYVHFNTYSNKSDFLKDMFTSTSKYRDSTIQDLSKDWNWFMQGIDGKSFAFEKACFYTQA